MNRYSKDLSCGLKVQNQSETGTNYSEKNALHLFVPKNVFLPLKICISGNKILDQHLGANSKKHCLQNFASIYLLFLPFSAFCTKNVKKAYFDQRLE